METIFLLICFSIGFSVEIASSPIFHGENFLVRFYEWILGLTVLAWGLYLIYFKIKFKNQSKFFGPVSWKNFVKNKVLFLIWVIVILNMIISIARSTYLQIHEGKTFEIKDDHYFCFIPNQNEPVEVTKSRYFELKANSSEVCASILMFFSISLLFSLVEIKRKT